MSAGKNLERALRRATARDAKRKPRMKVTGTSVFALKNLLRKRK